VNRFPARSVQIDMAALWPGRRVLRMTLGSLWLIAGALQLQRFMFTRNFAHDVLGSAALSQPSPLRQVITLVERVVAADPVPWNWLLALAELAIGTGMVLGRTGMIARVACWGSVLAGLGIWVVGEGLGGVLTGTAALSTGAPGAALLYSLLTLTAWPKPTESGGEQPLPRRELRALWLAVWLLGALLAVVPEQWGAAGLGAQATMGWMMSPHITVGVSLAVATWLVPLPSVAAGLLSAGLVVGHAATGLSIRGSSALERAFVIAGGVLMLGYWVFAQGFGGISTGTATDVGSAPLVVVLAVAVLATPARHPDRAAVARAATTRRDALAVPK
jgi:hypothetical protein